MVPEWRTFGGALRVAPHRASLPTPHRVRSRKATEPPGTEIRGTQCAGCLYIVSTPIGNLADITYRAVHVLSSVALIVAEDTRHSRTLLNHYHIHTPMASYHEHNEARETPRLVARLLAGDSIALISDAGTPLVSDPGSRLVQASVDALIPVVPIPGPSALLAAIVASGVPADRFAFYGFLPRKGKERTRLLAELVRSPITTVLYEAPSRVRATLHELATIGASDRHAVVARELTKKFEEIHRGTVAELAAQLGDELRGEIVIVLAGAVAAEVDEELLHAHVTEWRSEGASPRDIMDRLVHAFGVARNLAYRLAHDYPPA